MLLLRCAREASANRRRLVGPEPLVVASVKSPLQPAGDQTGKPRIAYVDDAVCCTATGCLGAAAGCAGASATGFAAAFLFAGAIIMIIWRPSSLGNCSTTI